MFAPVMKLAGSSDLSIWLQSLMTFHYFLFHFQPLLSAAEARFLNSKRKSHGSPFPCITCQWASALPGEPIKHIPATLNFGSVGLGLGPGICITV